MEKLFSYGTLREPQVQKQVYGRLVEGVPVRLRGYERRIDSTQTTRYWTIHAAKNAVVDGAVFELTAAELRRADEYEGDDYVRMRVTLENGDEAWVYIAP